MYNTTRGAFIKNALFFLNTVFLRNRHSASSCKGEKTVRFTKMEGLGNDYVYVNCLQEKVEDPNSLARKVSDRHFGIGSDGLILIKPSEEADFEMDMYNADGSRGKMCGNGIRCVGKYVYDHGLTTKKHLKIWTLGGTKELDLETEDGLVKRVRVDMGCPDFNTRNIPVEGMGDTVIEKPVCIGGMETKITCLSVGNPHCVVRVEDTASLDLEKIGPAFEHHPMFTEGVNTEFISVVDEKTLRMRVWERGSGETMACGTGSCASAVTALLNGWITSPTVTVKLLGGDLMIEWDRETDHIFMTGPATTVFEGEI